MSFKLRIFTLHHIPNNGAFLYAHALVSQLLTNFPSYDVKIVNYKTNRMALYEYLQLFKLFPKEPFFYYKRYRLWQKLLKNNIQLDNNFPRFSNEGQVQRYYSSNSNALLVGMDVWCIVNSISRPSFPNIYWIPEKIQIPKLAYGISAYNSDRSLINKHGKEITSYLNDFEVLGLRDRFTHELVLKYRTRTGGLVDRVPDPALLCDFPKTDISERAVSLGVDLNRPLLGLLLFGNSQLSESICSHFRAKGYQILALSMYNPHADINLGHILNPFQWAEFFGLLSFCITDRFHGTVFCIKNEIPFMSLENERIPRDQSKLYDLLTDFNLTSCYTHLYEDENSPSQIISRVDEIEGNWKKSLKPLVKPMLIRMHEHHRDFIDKMRILLG
jgi:hypothetical protein